MKNSGTEGEQWRAAGHAAEQGKEPGAHILLHSEPLENFNQEGDIASATCYKEHSDHNSEGAKGRATPSEDEGRNQGNRHRMLGGQGQECRTGIVMAFNHGPG